MNALPEKFEASMRETLGVAFPAFVASLQEAPPVSIRLHPLKNYPAATHPPVPWTAHGRYLPARPVFTIDPLFHAGTYYVQEASSMFLEQALKQTTDLERQLNILDLCAAPGGKSTHLLSLINRDSLLVSNEVIRSRASILSENIQKWGYPNAVVTNNDPSDFSRLESFFDVIVMDAPCSGEGLFRKDPDAMTEWSPENVQHCCNRQKRIIADVWTALKDDGILIYSTCTYNAFENEANLKWLTKNYAVEFQTLALDPSWGIEEITDGKTKGYRFYPHRVQGEGFFLSVVRKTGSTGTSLLKKKKPLTPPSRQIQERLNGWIAPPGPVTFFQFNDLVFYTPSAPSAAVEFLLQNLKIIYAGTNLATLKHDKLIPHHALSLAVDLNKENFPTADLPEQEALKYLRKDVIYLEDAATGFTLLTCHNAPLGWANVLPNRVNNLYPLEWRIRYK